MHGLFSVLSMAVRPYTITHMVAGYVEDPLDEQYTPNCQLATIAPDTHDNSFTDDKMETDAIHCDTNHKECDVSLRVISDERALPEGVSATCATPIASVYSASFIYTNQTDNIPTCNATKSMRLRGAGGESQEQLDAMITLSEDGRALFKRLVRKALVMTYNEGISLTDVLNNFSLTNINTGIEDDEVNDLAWQSYNPHISWADDDEEEEYEEDEDEYEDDDGDVYYDADEWSEGDTLVGALSYWNNERNYGIIIVLDDYSHTEADGNLYDTASGEIFCHGSYFIDGENCDLEPGDLVWFTVTWDTKRDRWHAVNIDRATLEELYTFAYDNGMDRNAVCDWFDYTVGQ